MVPRIRWRCTNCARTSNTPHWTWLKNCFQSHILWSQIDPSLTHETHIEWSESTTYRLLGECNLNILINFQVFASCAKMKICACLPSSLTYKLNAHRTRIMSLTVGIFIHKIWYLANVQARRWLPVATDTPSSAGICRHRCHFREWRMEIAPDKLKIYNAIHKKWAERRHR